MRQRGKILQIRARNIRQYNMAQGPHTRIVCNTYRYSTATMMTRTCLIVTFLRTLPLWFFHTNFIPNGTHKFDEGILQQRDK